MALIANLSEFWRITRELDINGLRESFERPVSLKVLGSDLSLAERVARLVEPDPEDVEITAAVLGGPLRERADAYIVAIGGPLDAEARRALSDLSVGEEPLLVVQSEEAEGLLVLGIPDERIVTLGATEADDEVRDRLFKALVQAAPEVILSAGRRHPLLREPIADHLIFDTSRVNAQFAVLASLPATLPIFGGLVGDVADTIVLTKNQVLLLFKLAGLYGRDVEFGPELLLEILPVVGGAFFWRTTARALVGLLPPILGLLPRTVVAYTGTFVVGQSARYYYRFGNRPPPEIAEELRREAQRLAEATIARLPRPR